MKISKILALLTFVVLFWLTTMAVAADINPETIKDILVNEEEADTNNTTNKNKQITVDTTKETMSVDEQGPMRPAVNNSVTDENMELMEGDEVSMGELDEEDVYTDQDLAQDTMIKDEESMGTDDELNSEAMGIESVDIEKQLDEMVDENIINANVPPTPEDVTAPKPVVVDNTGMVDVKPESETKKEVISMVRFDELSNEVGKYMGITKLFVLLLLISLGATGIVCWVLWMQGLSIRKDVISGANYRALQNKMVQFEREMEELNTRIQSVKDNASYDNIKGLISDLQGQLKNMNLANSKVSGGVDNGSNDKSDKKDSLKPKPADANRIFSNEGPIIKKEIPVNGSVSTGKSSVAVNNGNATNTANAGNAANTVVSKPASNTGDIKADTATSNGDNNTNNKVINSMPKASVATSNNTIATDKNNGIVSNKTTVKNEGQITDNNKMSQKSVANGNGSSVITSNQQGSNKDATAVK